MTDPQPDEETLAFAHRLFELAREGGSAELAGYRRSAVTVGLLLAAGADPDAGGPSARETARFFELPGMAALLDGPS